MSQPSEPDLGDRIAEKSLDLLGRLAEGGAEIVKGVYATPWTGVPFTLLVLSQIDPSGKLTKKFLDNLGQFLTALGTLIGDALRTGLQDVAKTVLPPVITPKSNKAITPYLILAGPFNPDAVGTIAAEDYLAASYLPFIISGFAPAIVTGTDGNLYVVDKNHLAT